MGSSVKELRIESNIPLILISLSIIVIVFIGYLELKKISNRITALEISSISSKETKMDNIPENTLSELESEANTEDIVIPNSNNIIYDEDNHPDEVYYNENIEDNMTEEEDEIEEKNMIDEDDEDDGDDGESKEIIFNPVENFTNKEVIVNQINQIFNQENYNEGEEDIEENKVEFTIGVFGQVNPLQESPFQMNNTQSYIEEINSESSEEDGGDEVSEREEASADDGEDDGEEDDEEGGEESGEEGGEGNGDEGNGEEDDEEDGEEGGKGEYFVCSPTLTRSKSEEELLLTGEPVVTPSSSDNEENNEEEVTNGEIEVTHDMSVNQLRSICKDMGLPLSGSKSILIKRIKGKQ